MSRCRLVDVVCFRCQRVLASEAEDGSWSVKIAERTGDRFRTITTWRQTFICPDRECRAEGFVETGALVCSRQDRRRVRVPVRPFV